MERFYSQFEWNFGQFYLPSVQWSDIAEILIIAIFLYYILIWFKNTRAWSFLKGLALIFLFILFAAVFNMSTILWIVKNVAGIAIIALVVILQPELRNAMDELGQKKWFSPFDIFSSHEYEERFSDKTKNEIVRACSAMAKVKTGALIVIENTTPLREYERTGIDIDAMVSSQLLINIFQKNTPLHDGAVIVKGDRITSATCYLPLSDNNLDKDLGTRHRAGVGISEVSDSLTVIVSEETGYISAAYKGMLSRNITAAELEKRLNTLQNKQPHDGNKWALFKKGRGKDE